MANPLPWGVHAEAITITPRLVIFVVVEHYGVLLIRAFYAVRVEDGHLVARGQDAYPSEFSERERPRLMQVRNKIYFLTTEDFFEINEEDILAGRNGWKPVTTGQ